jgi:hypothetical protein
VSGKILDAFPSLEIAFSLIELPLIVGTLGKNNKKTLKYYSSSQNRTVRQNIDN